MADKNTVMKVAELARLHLDPNQLSSMEEQFNKILGYFAELQEVNTENIDPMRTPHDIKTNLRKDVVKKDITVEEILKNAPEVKDSLFKVPPVV